MWKTKDKTSYNGNIAKPMVGSIITIIRDSLDHTQGRPLGQDAAFMIGQRKKNDILMK